MRAILLVMLVACGSPPEPGVTASATRASELDAVFHQEPRWLGGDGAYSIPMHDGRTLWLFGDSFVATSDAHVRTESTMVRNSIGVMTGTDLATATMQFVWREDTQPRSFFPEEGDHWFWPSDGAFALFDSEIYLFLNEVKSSSDGLGFASAGFRAVHITTSSAPPTSWPIDTLPYRTTTGGIACVGGDIDTHELFAITDDGHVLRWSGDAIAQAAPASSEKAEGLEPGSECSIHRDPTTKLWIYVWSRGFGDTTLAMKTATSPEGPWSSTVDLLKPPESMVADAFVYAGKAHPDLKHGGATVVTFADNSFTFGDLFDPAKASTLYWPHVALLNVD